MDKNTEKVNLLLIKLENLLLKQQSFEAEISSLKQEVKQLQFPGAVPTVHLEKLTDERITVPVQNTIFPPKYSPAIPNNPTISSPVLGATSSQSNFGSKFNQSDFEKFIGENLINKIGILILIIGVAIGTKYAIDKDMLSPLTRIILGYLVGIGLMGFALKLKTKYKSFSAVLLSGSIAIMYFLTYAAYDFYGIIPQALAFGLMVIFTSFTVFAAIKYDKQVIAQIGLVGAYGVPFLLSDGSGKILVLFSYMTIINIGILVLSLNKYWKPLFYLSFGLTWIIFSSWLSFDYKEIIHFQLALVFSAVFFITFYITNLAYKINKIEAFGIKDVFILLLNSFIFYALGYYILSEYKNGEELLGLFTLINAILHFIVSLVIYKRKLADKNLFYFVLAMVITFITMAVPVQLNGNWVTVFWVVEASILFYLGRIKNISIYEKLSFPLIFLAFLSLLQDWSIHTPEFKYYDQYIPVTPFLNVGFLSATIFIAAFLGMLTIIRKDHDNVENLKSKSIKEILTYAIPTILILVIYYTFRIEISIHFQNIFENTSINTSPNRKESLYEYNYDYKNFKIIAVYIYTLFFASILTYINLCKIKSKNLAIANMVINVIIILAFLTQGLFILSELRETYILQNNKYFASGFINIGIRYISLGFFALLLKACYQLTKTNFLKGNFITAFDYLCYISLLWIISSELLNVLSMSGLTNGYKLGLSILWGVYALFLISMGLWKNKKYLRIGAIVLFAFTLIKLFIYDISSLDTISKTIVFVALGVLLLIISFLYNKYKYLIVDDVKIKN